MTEACFLCKSKKLELIKSRLRNGEIKYKIFGCKNCNLIQLLPRPAVQENKKFYDKNLQDKDTGKEIDFWRLHDNNLFDTKRHVQLTKSLCKNKDCKILDIGTGYGFFLNALFDAGYRNVMGIEISKERRLMALKHGKVKIINFDVNNPDRKIGKYDVVTLFHVLEHMSNPVLFLKNIKKLIKPQGRLICEVPNVKEMLLDNCKEYNNFYWIRAHLNYFCKETLVKCFKKAKYNDIKIKFKQRYGLMNLFNWLIIGKPQIEKPTFEIGDNYKAVESFYKKYLESIERSDAIIAIARLK
jgi:2-polyprenyl-3-methyl-5-hydroxy-6-metoxy-1,4-benzoquinol methylase